MAFTKPRHWLRWLIEVAGHIRVLFAEWNIANPSFAGFVTTQNYGQLEFLLVFSRS